MKKTYIFILATFFIIIPLIIFLADIFDITQYVKLTPNYDWLAFLGSIYATVVTILGVFLTLEYQRKIDNKKRIEDHQPDIIIDIDEERMKTKNELQVLTPEEIEFRNNYIDIYPQNHIMTFSLKNVGKETAKNIKCIAKLKGLKDVTYNGITIKPEEEIISTAHRAIFGYIRNSTFNILAIQKNEKKEINLSILESIIEVFGKSIIEDYTKETGDNEKYKKYIKLEQTIFITVEYQDLIGEKYQKKFELLFTPIMVYPKEKRVEYIVKIV